MHIHGNPMISHGANVHSAAAQKAESAQRAAETRKRLLKGGFGLEGELSPEEGFMIGRWTEGGSQEGRRQERDDHSAGPQAAEGVPPAKPVSVWA